MREKQGGERKRERFLLYIGVGKVVGERFVVGIFGKGRRERERCKGFVRFHVIQCRWRISELS